MTHAQDLAQITKLSDSIPMLSPLMMSYCHTIALFPVHRI